MLKNHFQFNLIFILFFSVDTMIAQVSEELEFASGQLSEISDLYAGSTNNWPIVRSLADFNYATNRYFLGSKEVGMLNTFKRSWEKLDNSRQAFSRLTAEGGQIFAPQELHHIDSLFTTYRYYINDADIGNAVELADRIVTRVDEVTQLVEERRIADVEAKLDQKSGRVDHKRGLLGDWMESFVGDFYFRSDGIRTGIDSQAQLLFVDGSDVVLYENTTALIHQSRVDKLTNRSDVEIELSDGSLLTRLSSNSLNDSRFLLNAGNSTSEIRSSNFWVETTNEDRVTLSNFNGVVIVGAEQTQVSLLENEGTFVVRGREPVAPIRLLPAPELNVNTTDLIHYMNDLQMSWQPVAGAHFYEADLSRVPTFDSGLQTLRTEELQITFQHIPEGISYLQVRAYDENGLRGVNSRTIRILRIVSDVPPPIILDTKNQPVVFSYEPQYLLTGITESGAILHIDGDRVPVDSNGRFEKIVSVVDEKEVDIKATNSAGISRNITQTIRYVDLDEIFNLQWSVLTAGNEVRRAPRILISGQAYQFLNVQIQAGENRYDLPVGASGRWAREINAEEANEIIIRFKDRTGGEILTEKTFKIVSP